MKHALYALLLLASAANAGPATVTATAPITYTDGSNLPASDITGYVWECSFTPTGGVAAACTGFTGGTVTGSSPNAAVSFTAPAAGGSVCFQVVAKTAASTSARSTVGCKAVAPLVPSAPTNVTVTITIALNLTSDSPITVAMAAPVVTTSP